MTYTTQNYGYFIINCWIIIHHQTLIKKIKPTISKANERYISRSPKYILPSHNHEYIKLTCRYQLIHQYNANGNGNDAENNMDHISSPNPIKTDTKRIKHWDHEELHASKDFF